MKKIKLMDIVIDAEIIVRDVNTFIVSNYVESMRAGDVFPPIIVDVKNRLVCGHTRYAAFKKIYEPDHAVDCIVSKYTKNVDLIIEAAKDNSRHGHPLDTYEKKCIALKLKNYKIGVDKISEVLGVTRSRIEEWGGMTVNVIGPDGKKEPMPIKKGKEEMAGKTVSSEDYTSHRNNDLGVSVKFHAQKLLIVMKRGKSFEWVEDDEKTVGVLRELHKVIAEYLRFAGR